MISCTGIWFILVFTYTRIISDLCTIYEKQLEVRSQLNKLIISEAKKVAADSDEHFTMAHVELDSFYFKFKNLLYAGRDATLNVKSENGRALVTLSLDLGHVLDQDQYTKVSKWTF